MCNVGASGALIRTIHNRRKASYGETASKLGLKPTDLSEAQACSRSHLTQRRAEFDFVAGFLAAR